MTNRICQVRRRVFSFILHLLTAVDVITCAMRPTGGLIVIQRFSGSSLTHVQVFQLWDTSVVKFLGQRYFAQGTELRASRVQTL
jgi:hypothetical protein